ncbi:sensor histidine kinase [Halorarius litoreus]|uniref:sensor histidine kinase n=1 Tax=Halorarius litoreus TaxID=2962676 RepID=UPI0020CC03D3|nr:HAMP domain-containing sensor histidine kinase [Halorarius litoreus]
MSTSIGTDRLQAWFGEQHWAAWVISGVGLALAGLSLWYLIVVKALYLGSVVGTGPLELILKIIEVLLLASFSLVLVYGGYWLASGAFEGRRLWWAGLWTMLGLAGVVAIVAFVTAFQVSQGEPISEPTLIQEMLLAAGGGGIAGLLIGVSTVRETVEAEDAKHQRDTLLFVNELLRHNVLNGMQVIMANTDRLSEQVDDPEVQRLLDANENRAETVVDLIQNVRALVRSVSGEVELLPLALTPVLSDEVEAVRQAYPAATVEFEAYSDVTVRADELLPAVFENVIRNAIDHNDADDPHVTVRVETSQDRGFVRVADNGPGIPDEWKTEYFNAGEQGPESIGQGLGLYLVDTLVERYGGEVHIEDNDPRGSVVVFEFERVA